MGVLLQKHCHFATNHCHFCTILPKLSRARYSSTKFLREKKGDNRGLIYFYFFASFFVFFIWGKKGGEKPASFFAPNFCPGQGKLPKRVTNTYRREGENVYT